MIKDPTIQLTYKKLLFVSFCIVSKNICNYLKILFSFPITYLWEKNVVHILQQQNTAIDWLKKNVRIQQSLIKTQKKLL